MKNPEPEVPVECKAEAKRLNANEAFRWKNILAAVIGRISDSPIAHRLAKGAFWSLVGTAATRVFTVFSTICIARILGKENFGVLGMVLSTLGMLGTLAGFSLGSTTTKYLSEYRTKDPFKAGRILTLTNTTVFITGGVILGIILSAAPWLAQELLNKPDLGTIVRIGGLLLFLNALNEVQVGTLAGFEAFKSIAKINFWQGLSSPLLAIPFVFYQGVSGAIYAQSLVTVIGLILCKKEIRIECIKFNICFRRFSLSSILEERSVLWKFSIPALASGLLVMPVIWVCNMMLVRQQNGYAELGLFNAANQWRLIIIIFPQILASIMLPIFSEVHGQGNKENFQHALNFNLSLTWIFALPLTIIVIIFREPLSTLFGKQYIGMSPIIALLMFTAFLNIVNNVIGTALAGAGKMWIGTLFNLGWAAVLICGNFFLVPLLGGMGMAIAYLIAYFFHTAWQMVYTELILAPTVISRNYRLVIITFASTIPIAVISFINYRSVIVNVLILSLSLIPIVELGIDKLPKFKSA